MPIILNDTKTKTQNSNPSFLAFSLKLSLFFVLNKQKDICY